MIRLLLSTTAALLLGGLSQFATPLAISAQDGSTIRVQARVVSADAAWDAHRTAQRVVDELAVSRDPDGESAGTAAIGHDPEEARPAVVVAGSGRPEHTAPIASPPARTDDGSVVSEWTRSGPIVRVTVSHLAH